MADRIEDAATMVNRYAAAATDPSLVLMMNIRQACAEGRTADAEAMYDAFDFRAFGLANNNVEWLALKTIGREAEAEALLRPLDEPDFLFVLVGFLNYTHFDPRPFPNLTALLEAQGVMREAPMPMHFACRPAAQPSD